MICVTKKNMSETKFGSYHMRCDWTHVESIIHHHPPFVHHHPSSSIIVFHPLSSFFILSFFILFFCLLVFCSSFSFSHPSPKKIQKTSGTKLNRKAKSPKAGAKSTPPRRMIPTIAVKFDDGEKQRNHWLNQGENLEKKWQKCMFFEG